MTSHRLAWDSEPDKCCHCRGDGTGQDGWNRRVAKACWRKFPSGSGKDRSEAGDAECDAEFAGCATGVWACNDVE